MGRPERFAQKVLAALRRAVPTLSPGPTFHPETFSITAGPDLVVNLQNVFDAYQKASFFRRGRILETFIASISAPEIPSEFKEVRDSLLPKVRDRLWYAMTGLYIETEGLATPLPASRPLTELLAVELVYDSRDQMALVSQAHLDGWKRTYDDVRGIAIANLRARSTGSFEEPRPGFFVSPWRDNHDASRLLLGDVLGRLRVKGDLVAAVPNRDHLLVTGSDDAEGLTEMFAWIERLAREPRFMTRTPVVFAGDKWSELVLPDGHPARPALLRLAAADQVHANNEQKAALERLHVKTGRDVYVAETEAFESKDDGMVHTRATWSMNVRTLLPRTSMVVFFDDTRAEHLYLLVCPWEAVRATVGHHMVEERAYPPRWFIDDFPSADELAVLAKAEGAHVVEKLKAAPVSENDST